MPSIETYSGWISSLRHTTKNPGFRCFSKRIPPQQWPYIKKGKGVDDTLIPILSPCNSEETSNLTFCQMFIHHLPTSTFQLPPCDFQLPPSNFHLPTSTFQLPTSCFFTRQEIWVPCIIFVLLIFGALLLHHCCPQHAMCHKWLPCCVSMWLDLEVIHWWMCLDLIDWMVPCFWRQSVGEQKIKWPQFMDMFIYRWWWFRGMFSLVDMFSLVVYGYMIYDMCLVAVYGYVFMLMLMFFFFNPLLGRDDPFWRICLRNFENNN